MNKRNVVIVVVAVIAALGIGARASAVPIDINGAPLLFFADGTEAGGTSIIVRDAGRGTISARIDATQLEPGVTYTYWWVVFNDPGACLVAFSCGLGDLFVDPDDESAGFNVEQINRVGISVLGGNGQITDSRGRATFTGTLFADSPLGHDVVIGPGGLLEGGGMLPVNTGALLVEANVLTAEIHIVLRSHGPPLSGAALAAQLHTFAGNCIGLDPAGTDECEEPQFAIHE